MTITAFEAYSIAVGVLTLAAVGFNIGLVLWVHRELAAIPAAGVNTRAILGAVEALRVAVSMVDSQDEDHDKAISEKLGTIISMLDVYVLRVTGVPTGKRPQ